MNTLEIISVLVATAALFGWISTRVLKLPITIGNMLLTVCCSVLLLALAGIVPGLHQWAEDLAHRINFEVLILHGMLPLLLFAGAFLLDLDHLAREKLPVSVFALFGTALSFAAVSALMKFFAGDHASWTECMIFGALISPTDPVAVLEMLRRVGVSETIQAQLAGESLFNDGIGAVLFLTMIQIAHGHQPTPWSVAGMLLLQAGGAIVLGILGAWVISKLMCTVLSYQVDILLTLALALGGYVLADVWHLSGPLEAVAAGLALRYFNRKQPEGLIADEHVDEFWTLTEEVQNSVLFVLLGLELMVVPLNLVTARAGGASIFSVNLVRFGVVSLCVLLLRICGDRRKASIFTLGWGGLRGGLSIALALSVPPSLGQTWILGATYVTVVFSILVQGGSLNMIMSRKKKALAAT